ncbi:MBL fold metallo-hydrolase [Calderihabitans maritimus]|uniref:Metallo-beta-lactamase domain-containing protein n=1 Tax=Calderihabitans maritimus TaxID=1246530 RepID=A0A1Z5HPM6_9FIRM|nr:MBL fold metallo-hydrolase [Calderihabitans maritimus]GAW91464.1 hypothetical protein KKC1_06260 [Calderihabitans maritimus]
MVDIQQLPCDIFQVDLEDCGHKGRTAGYFVRGEEWMLIETGPASSAEVVVRAAEELGTRPEEVKYLAVTHIHLDHAGGLGVLSRHFPKATAVVHPRGVKHMVDPSRLRAGALAVFGPEKMKELGEIEPLSEDRIMAAGEGTVLSLGNRVLEVWETPGHAKHHICIYDRQSRGLFSGDAAGVFSPELSRQQGSPVLRPATPPPDFDGALMFKSLSRMALREIDRIYYTHFGLGEPARQLLEIVAGQVAIWLEIAKNLKKAGKTAEELVSTLEEYSRQWIFGDTKDMPNNLSPAAAQEWDFLFGMLNLSAKGIFRYIETL